MSHFLKDEDEEMKEKVNKWDKRGNVGPKGLGSGRASACLQDWLWIKKGKTKRRKPEKSSPDTSNFAKYDFDQNFEFTSNLLLYEFFDEYVYYVEEREELSTTIQI